jgi:hypothetical protein
MESATGDVINADTMSDQQNITAISASSYVVTRELQASRTDKGSLKIEMRGTVQMIHDS